MVGSAQRDASHEPASAQLRLASAPSLRDRRDGPPQAKPRRRYAFNILRHVPSDAASNCAGASAIRPIAQPLQHPTGTGLGGSSVLPPRSLSLLMSPGYSVSGSGILVRVS